ncbi:MAG: right-handed parallel beta-helix repeat-containing protein [Cyanobacteria bacterium P01_F01_bin.150]
MLMPLGILPVLLLGTGVANALPALETSTVVPPAENQGQASTLSSDAVHPSGNHVAQSDGSGAADSVVEEHEVTDAHGPEFADAHATAADLRIEPRFNVGHTTSGGWMNGLSRISGWIPLRQQVGEDVTFIEPRIVLDNEGHWGGNFLLGHREYDEDGNRLWAGYASIDIREAEEGTCDQLGLGMETLGDKWDVHLNGYIPIGSCRRNLEESFFTTGDGISSSATFEGNQLILSETQGSIRSFTDQIAVGGFDLGTTVELAEWDDGDGDLRALAGIYHLGAEGIDDAFGWRLGLEARPTEQIVLGVVYQEDEMFGTNVMASITFSFPRVRPKGDVLDEFEEDYEVVERLGEPIRRNHTIVMNTISGQESDLTVVSEPLFNPQNGTDENPSAYRFIHVDLGAASNGDGTAESPYNNIDDALANASRNSGTANGNPETAENQIVYVDASSNTDIDAFEIPAGVRVLSQAPTQLLNGSNDSFSTFPVVEGRLPFSPENNFNTGTDIETGIVVTLPGSGDGDFPILDSGADDLIVMNSNTVLSGFIINNAASDAIFADGAENIEIRDSFINNVGERGISLNNVVGSVILFDNSLTNIGDEGIAIFNDTPPSTVEVTARRQTIDNARVGIALGTSGGSAITGNSTQIVDIEDSEITNSIEQGLLMTTSEVGNQEVNFRAVDGQATITGSGQEGIRIEAITSGSQEVTIEGATIANNGSDGTHAGIEVIGGILDDIETDNNTAAQEVFIFDSAIANNTGAGISIEGNGEAAQEFGISRNTITNNLGGGIVSTTNNSVFQEFVRDDDNLTNGIFSNTITGNTGQGIDLNANDSSTLLADISANTLSNTATTDGNPELDFTANSNSVDACAFIFQNNAGSSSIVLDSNSSGNVSAFFEVVDLNDALGVLSSNTTLSGTVTLLPDSSAFADNVGATDSCFTDED